MVDASVIIVISSSNTDTESTRVLATTHEDMRKIVELQFPNQRAYTDRVVKIQIIGKSGGFTITSGMEMDYVVEWSGRVNSEE